MAFRYTCRRCRPLVQQGAFRQLIDTPQPRSASQRVLDGLTRSSRPPRAPIAGIKRGMYSGPSDFTSTTQQPFRPTNPDEGLATSPLPLEDQPTRVLREDELFHSFSKSPVPGMRKRAAFIKQHAYCPHSSHRQTRAPVSPHDPEARKSATSGVAPAHVNFECPDCGVPVACCEEHWMEEFESHLEICDILREINEDDHDLRSGRFFPEFVFPGPQMEEALVNMTNWDTYLYTRQYEAINAERSLRHATRMLTYPMTIASILDELSPYNIRQGGRLTPEGLKSFSGKSGYYVSGREMI
jgi:mitochondrial splicing suppressor protein 51